jgi:hypothetical protein
MRGKRDHFGLKVAQVCARHDGRSSSQVREDTLHELMKEIDTNGNGVIDW